MGSRKSKSARIDRATTPLSSWGGSFDDLICGPGAPCADEWTPPPSRVGSWSDLRTPRSRRYSAEVFMVEPDHRRQSIFDSEIITQQPMPIFSETPRNPYDVPTRRSSLAYVPVRKSSRRKKRKRSKRPSRRKSMGTMAFVHVSEPLPHPKVRARSISVPRRRRIEVTRVNSAAAVASTTIFQESLNGNTKTWTRTTVRRVVPPRNKPYAAPPPAFLVRGIPDTPYIRMKTPAPFRFYE